MRFNYIVEPPLRDLGLQSMVVAEVSGLRVQQHNQELEAIKATAATEVLQLTESEIIDNPVLQSYRQLVRTIGRSPKRFPPAAETLIRQVRRLGKFPEINTAVDSYNVVVSRRHLALGVHDMAKLGSTIRFRLSPGGEGFTPVGSDSLKTTQPGDYIYADDRQVLAWMDSRDSDLVKIGLDTTDLVIVIQGTPATSTAYNLAAAEEACNLITRFCGGTFTIHSLQQ